ncbi:PREDICTED: uncharacterized protein LOC105460537 isoform X2 [Wasmannia auropunctata]|uniref:uncharacterized protein LOC105460537 isoform X2 n=1 Tax=Wasmannia auropunctata TaxID=64793 RepID=UPI0005EE1A2C|nr:PREDICTED: uncharacterized protein LOC105460537 isoform X2 [Wasmannia auropunctata]
MLIYVFYVLSVAVFGLSSAAETTVLVTCKRGSVNYFACLKHAVEEVWPQLSEKGLSEFDFPALDPLLYEYGKAVFNTDIIHAEVIISNLTIIGISKTHFNGVRAHFLDDVFRLEIDTVIPKIFLKGTAKLDGTLGILRIVDKGPFNLNIDEVITTWDITGHIINDTMIVEHFRMLPSVKKLEIYFEFFQGNKEINDVAVNFVNEFWPPLYRAMLPLTSEAWDSWLSALCNRLFSKMSFSKLFPK